jgi:4-amino-4-deoxy-L-arabinose transferase-like glycosyltransferase
MRLRCWELMKSFRMLTLAACAAAIVPRLVQRGMFVDGVTYASIARNLSEGRGSFWSPSYTATIYPQFHEHPPFGFWLQSLWFRVLGDHPFVERAYSLAAALGTAWLIALTWRRLNKAGGEGPAGAGPDARAATDFDWLPVLFWILVPAVSWAIVGNLLEASMSLLTTAAVAAAAAAAVAGRPAESARWGIVAGLCVVAAALTKGPVGLFPLAAPVMFWLISGRRRALASLGGQWGTVVLCALALFSFDAPRASLAQYLNQQVLASLGGRREISAGSWTIVIQLVSGVLAPMILAGGLIVAAARRYLRPRQPQIRQAAALSLLGLAGTLPMVASVKQAGHYLVPAVPLFALAAASLFAPTLAAVLQRVAVRPRDRLVNSLSVLVLLVAMGISYVPALGRDRPRLADLDVLEASVPRGTTIGICPESNGDWGLHAWFERRFAVSLDAAHGQEREWFLATAAPRPGCPPAGCTPATDPRRQLVLMKCSR